MSTETVQFEKSWVFYLFVVLLSWAYFIARGRYPLSADAEGITTRSGKRHLFADAIEIKNKRGGGVLGAVLLGTGVDIKFSTGWVGIYPNMWKNGHALRDVVLARLKEKKGLQAA